MAQGAHILRPLHSAIATLSLTFPFSYDFDFWWR
ncbi:Uncharacterised protein [Serratia fonticola]|nr:Uncharacterised protein [Serratia fonticola]